MLRSVAGTPSVFSRMAPENADWLFDYGESSFSGAYYDYDPYYYGGYGDEYDDGRYDGDYYEEDYYEDDYGRPHFSVRSTVAEANFAVEPLSQAYDRTYTTQAAVLEGYTFDRVRYRVSGDTFRSADMAHWLALDVAAQALAELGHIAVNRYGGEHRDAGADHYQQAATGSRHRPVLSNRGNRRSRAPNRLISS